MTPLPVTHAGLFAGSDAHPVPLSSVEVEGSIVGPCARVTVVQTYTNAESVPIEAVYVFPLDTDAALCGFAATVGSRRVEGRIEERERAFEIYDDALADGDGAFLVDQERPNVFTASVGNLAPGATARVELQYVTLVADEGDARRFVLPTTVSPRYVTDAGPEIGQPDGERINPERRLSTDYGLSLRLELDVPEGLSEVESPSHPIRTRLTDAGAVVELSQVSTRLDRDFVLLVTSLRPREPFVRVAAEEDGTRVALISFRPDVEALLGDRAAGSEVTFVLDCSGSMHGSSIDQAKRALSLCLRTLDTGDAFNIVRFGSSFDSLWPRARAYDAASLAAASDYLERTGADLGGTEILAPLRSIYSQPTDPERPRQILLLTDGQVSNEAAIIELARQHASVARVFTFGIGAGASDHLVKGVARASRGAAEFIFPGERIEPKVLRMFNRVRTPALNDARVDFGGLDVELAPRVLPPVFAGDRLNVFARVRGGAAQNATLHAAGRSWSLPLDLERPEGGSAIATLWARARIRELDGGAPERAGSAQSRGRREERAKEQLVALSKRYGIVSSATSFVAVDVRDAADKTTEAAALRPVPVQLTDGWGGTGRLKGGAGGAPTMRTSRGMVRAVAAASLGGMAPPAPSGFAAPAPQMAESAKMTGPPKSGGLLASVFGRSKRKRGRGADQLADMPAPLMEQDAFADDEHPEAGDGTGLYTLLLTQSADGAFDWSGALAACLGDTADRAKRAVETASNRRVAATALVLAVLERDWADRADEWRGAADKARRWMAAQPTDFDAAAVLASS